MVKNLMTLETTSSHMAGSEAHDAASHYGRRSISCVLIATGGEKVHREDRL